MKFLKYFFTKKYEIYTDGSLKNGIGSWAFIVVYKNKIIHEASGSKRKTGSNEMELFAATQALKHLPPGSRAELFSDSRILVDMVNLWIPEWKKQGWSKKNRRPIPFADQAREIDFLIQHHFISWFWIKAHSGKMFNEYCDELCVRARLL